MHQLRHQLKKWRLKFPNIKFEKYSGITHGMIYQKYVLNTLYDMLDRTKPFWQELLKPMLLDNSIYMFAENELYFYFTCIRFIF